MLKSQATAQLAADAFRSSVVDALKAGGSVREVAEATGMSTHTIRVWGSSSGWPTEAQRAVWAAAKAKREEFTEGLRAAQDWLDKQ